MPLPPPEQSTSTAGRAAAPPEIPLRRQPVQRRSARRVEQMLDACAELISEHGSDGVTTTLIAKRAGVAVGSLYQFFPDKKAVIRALTHRYLERFVGEVTEGLRQVGDAHWWDVVDMVLDTYIRMHRELPGFADVHFGDAVDKHLLDAGRDNNSVVSAELARLITARTGLPPSEVTLPLDVAVEAADALLKLAFRRDPAGDPRVVGETKQLLRGYLASRFDG